MIFLHHEQRYSASSLLSCHIIVFLTVPFYYLNACFTLIINKLPKTPLLAVLGRQQGGIMYQIMNTNDISMGLSLRVFQT